jgi:hypothetical protein
VSTVAHQAGRPPNCGASPPPRCSSTVRARMRAGGAQHGGGARPDTPVLPTTRAPLLKLLIRIHQRMAPRSASRDASEEWLVWTAGQEGLTNISLGDGWRLLAGRRTPRAARRRTGLRRGLAVPGFTRSRHACMASSDSPRRHTGHRLRPRIRGTRALLGGSGIRSPIDRYSSRVIATGPNVIRMLTALCLPVSVEGTPAVVPSVAPGGNGQSAARY